MKFYDDLRAHVRPEDQADHIVYSFIQWAKLAHDLKPPPSHPCIYDL